MQRRDLLKTAAAFALACFPRELWALQENEEAVDFADLDDFKIELRPRTPRVRCFDLRRLTSWTTPESEFYTFHQTETVKAEEAQQWRLQISGLVERPRKFTLDELKQRPDRRDLAVTLECSGNSAGPGANGLVSNGVWTGVGLASVLKECGVKPEAREIAFLGMDYEMERNTFPTQHGRSVYVQDAMHADAMLAFMLNGQPLSPERGFPIRLILPGWYGMAHIKWLERIEVLDRRYEGAHMSRNYHTVSTLADTDQDLFIETSISRTRLKSVVARVTRTKLPAGGFAYRIAGAAWGGPSRVKAVEVSIDGNAWRPARITDQRTSNYAWALWSFDWADASAGSHTLISRATAADGTVQPTLAELRKTVKSAREDNSQWPRKIVISEI